MKQILTIVLFSLFLGNKLYAQTTMGPYAPPVGQNNTTAMFKDSTVFVDWANNCTVIRGKQDISDPSLGNASIGIGNSATGKSGLNGIVSLGDGGSATLTFGGLITNGIGADFAVFENSFDDTFLELAFVEVSSDGVNFFRFDAVSLTETEMQTGSFENTDATNIYNLAGKYRAQYGTPFDLDELTGIAGLDVNAVSHIRIIDVIGNIDSTYATYDSQNNPINDPWPTPFASSGFDLDAVGVINFIPTSVNEIKTTTLTLNAYPNPTFNTLFFDLNENVKYSYALTDINGRELQQGKLYNSLDVSFLTKGIYFLKVSTQNQFVVKKIVKK